MIKSLQTIRNASASEEFDYPFLMHALRDYAQPRTKVRLLIRNKSIVRVKKGIYVFGPELSKEHFNVFVLGNLIYGPSYISLESALSHYGMIPERVEAVTSVTTKRNRQFNTPLGRFTYTHARAACYSVGVTQLIMDERHPVLIATPEKALVDTLMLSGRGIDPQSAEELRQFLLEDLRLDEGALSSMDRTRLLEVANLVRNRTVDRLLSLVAAKRQA